MKAARLVLLQSPSSKNARILARCAAGIAFSVDLTLRWLADGFWDFFQGVDAGQLSSSHAIEIPLRFWSTEYSPDELW